jgi:putative two-component system response regulator
MGLPDTEAERIGYSAVLHDVGKIHVRDDILKKPGALTDGERAEMQKHTVVGEAILSDQPFFAMARQIARAHHENYDGSGYPDGRRGRAIPLSAGIVHVVDVFDALSSDRVYKRAWPLDRAAQAIRDGRETEFDPRVVDAFMPLFERGALEDLRQSLPACDSRSAPAMLDSPGS